MKVLAFVLLSTHVLKIWRSFISLHVYNSLLSFHIPFVVYPVPWREYCKTPSITSCEICRFWGNFLPLLIATTNGKMPNIKIQMEPAVNPVVGFATIMPRLLVSLIQQNLLKLPYVCLIFWYLERSFQYFFSPSIAKYFSALMELVLKLPWTPEEFKGRVKGEETEGN